jgi:YfiH family protein
VKLIEKEHCYIIDEVFPSNIIAGFTKPTVGGNLPQDINTSLSYLGWQFQISYLNQIHSSKVNCIENSGIYEGDALFSKKDDFVLIVKTADCLPIFFHSVELNMIGIVHMGWRGAKVGILGNINEDISSFKIVAGVGLRKCCYEVGEEFLNYPQFVDFLNRKNNKLYFDVVGFTKEQLRKKELREDNFFDLGICSFCSGYKLFSCRNDALSSRTLSFILKK